MTFLLRRVLISEGCSEDYMYLFLFSTLDTFILVYGSDLTLTSTNLSTGVGS